MTFRIQRIMAAALILTFTFVGCSKFGSDPKEVVVHFMLSVKNERYDQAYSVASPTDRKNISLADFTEQLSRETKRLPKMPEQPNVTIEINGTQGRARVLNWSMANEIKLVYLEGRWWIRK